MNSTEIATIPAADLAPLPSNHGVIADLAPATKTRTLDFTLVAGYLRGDHRCPFELHATGCRDLNKLKTLGLFSFNVYAESREAAHIKAVDELGGVAKLGDIWVQPCCTLKRMQAIGRA